MNNLISGQIIELQKDKGDLKAKSRAIYIDKDREGHHRILPYGADFWIKIFDLDDWLAINEFIDIELLGGILGSNSEFLGKPQSK